MSELLRLTDPADRIIRGQEIAARVGELGLYYTTTLPLDSEVVALDVLQGGKRFGDDLSAAVDHPAIIRDECRIRSMDGVSQGAIEFITKPTQRLEGRWVWVREDILDTGRTLKVLVDWMRRQEVLGISLAVAFEKPARRAPDTELDVDDLQVGFRIDDAFVIGYGLDYNEQFRDLPYVTICQFDEQGTPYPEINEPLAA